MNNTLVPIDTKILFPSNVAKSPRDLPAGVSVKDDLTCTW